MLEAVAVVVVVVVDVDVVVSDAVGAGEVELAEFVEEDGEDGSRR